MWTGLRDIARAARRDRDARNTRFRVEHTQHKGQICIWTSKKFVTSVSLKHFLLTLLTFSSITCEMSGNQHGNSQWFYLGKNCEEEAHLATIHHSLNRKRGASRSVSIRYCLPRLFCCAPQKAQKNYKLEIKYKAWSY